MKILQIGRLNWASQVEKLPEDLEWLFCEPEYIQNFLKLEEEKLLAESMKRMVKHDVLLEKPKIHIHFNAKPIAYFVVLNWSYLQHHRMGFLEERCFVN